MTDDWKQAGLCRDYPTAVFYPYSYQTDKVNEAKAICHRCPVKRQCLAAALANDEHDGVWGEKTYEERKRIIRNQHVVGVVVHGTRPGYRYHLYHGEDPCQACREANSRFIAAWRRDIGRAS